MATRWKSNSSMSSSTLEEENIATERDPLISIKDRLENINNNNNRSGSNRQGKFNGKYFLKQFLLLSYCI
jgi:hypothetical protein